MAWIFLSLVFLFKKIHGEIHQEIHGRKQGTVIHNFNSDFRTQCGDNFFVKWALKCCKENCRQNCRHFAKKLSPLRVTHWAPSATSLAANFGTNNMQAACAHPGDIREQHARDVRATCGKHAGIVRATCGACAATCEGHVGNMRATCGHLACKMWVMRNRKLIEMFVFCANSLIL